MLETGERENPDLERQSCGELGKRSAVHRRTEQWRVGILRVAQVVSSCARNQGNAEWLAVTQWNAGFTCVAIAVLKACLLDKDRKTRHVHVRFLWLQQAVREGRCSVSRQVKICQTRSRSPCPRSMRIAAIGV